MVKKYIGLLVLWHPGDCWVVGALGGGGLVLGHRPLGGGCLLTCSPLPLKRGVWGRAGTQETDCWVVVAAVPAGRGWSASGCPAAEQKWWGSPGALGAWLPEAQGGRAVNPAGQLACLRQIEAGLNFIRLCHRHKTWLRPNEKRSHWK